MEDKEKKIRFLSIVWYQVMPPKFGGQQGVGFFNRALARQAELACICTSDNDPTGENYPVWKGLSPGWLQLASPFSILKLWRAIGRHKPHYLIVEHPYYFHVAWMLSYLRRVKIILHSHNIEYSRLKVTGKPYWPVVQFLERFAHRHADLVLFKTAADQRLAVANFGMQNTPSYLLPFGINPTSKNNKKEIREALVQQWGLEPHMKIILFAGTLDYAPNADAVEKIYTQLAPSLDPASYRIFIAGRNRFPQFNYLQNFSHPVVVQMGEVDDLDGFMQGCDLFINPVETGSGVQTKTITALGFNCNVLAFEHMTDQDIITYSGEKLLTVPKGDWAAFSAAMISHSNSKGNTPDAFVHHFGWDNIVRRFLETLRP